ncbi:hypothetical protein SEUCBS139899_003913 [Sporothrix eucalyptigena]|uniref:Uncharacterized protein n=1 Tax=Sporothrix eucalyptigena TaxID=1812306 RepID=A0ABP0BTL5_9PEZI
MRTGKTSVRIYLHSIDGRIGHSTSGSSSGSSGSSDSSSDSTSSGSLSSSSKGTSKGAIAAAVVVFVLGAALLAGAAWSVYRLGKKHQRENIMRAHINTMALSDMAKPAATGSQASNY